jgi:acetylornithine/N-succinyldiaminopimelate aminotransferase
MLPDIVRSEGIYVYDSRGNRYMDLESGVWCMSLGHNHPELNAVINDQAGKVMHSGFTYSAEISERAAEKILNIAGLKDGKCVFLCSGSEAIELTRQISKKVTGKSKSMTLHDSYLGSYSSVKERDRDWYIFDWTECRSCKFSGSCMKDCPKIEAIPDGIAEFIFEPGSSSGFVRFPPEKLIHNIVEQVRRNGGKIIANEVTTGIGRTGKWFGFEHYGIEPDMIAVGKGIGNGYPVSISLMNENTAVQAEASGFRYMQSHQNDPMGAAVVLKVLDIIESGNLVSMACNQGEYFLDLLECSLQSGVVTGIRGRGLMIGVDICDSDTGNRIFEKLIAEGFIICNRGGLFRIDPPLIIDQNSFERFVSAFNSILAAES